MVIIIGYGFIGRSVYDFLKAKNYEVRVVSRSFEYKTEDFIEGELEQVPFILEQFENIDTIIHCVHTTVPANSMLDNAYDVQSNVLPFISLLEVCKKVTVKNFIYISSGGAVYGHPVGIESVDESHSTNPISSYGITKLACEKYLLINKEYFKGNCIILRPSNIFGLGQKLNKPQGVIGHIHNAVLNNISFEVWGDGNGKKDYLHIDSLTDAIFKVISYNKKINESVFNVSSGNLYSINFIIKAFEEKFQRKINVNYKSENKFDVKNIALSNESFCKRFDWQNKMSLEEYLSKL